MAQAIAVFFGTLMLWENLHPVVGACKSARERMKEHCLARAAVVRWRPMISLRGLGKTFGTQVAVESLSLEIPSGQIVGFLGPNGAGKTTTLKMLTGLLVPSRGTAEIAGFDLRRQPLEVKRH